MNALNSPASADLAITGRCNLRCTYCSHFSGAGDTGRDLPAEAWLAFFEELGRCAVMNVTLQGGEPFCREDLNRIVEGIVRNRMRFKILSNGTRITDASAEFLKSTGRCDAVQVSLDGSEAAVHDAFRGEGNFSRAIRGIECLQRRGLRVTVRVTIHRENVRDLAKIAGLLLEDIGLAEFSTNSAGYMGLCRQNTEKVQLTARERTLAMETLLELDRTYPGRINASAGPLAEGRTWRSMVQAADGGRESLPGGGYLSGCNGPLHTIAVRSDGAIVPCVQMSHMELGRIDTHDLRTLWRSHPQLARLRNRRRIPLKNFEFCRGCDYIEYCTGNCPGIAYTVYGEENHPSPDACLKRFLEDGGRLYE